VQKLSVRDRERIRKLHKSIQFWGTPENGYLDSGLWNYLDNVYTHDTHDLENPEKLLMADGKIYLTVLFLFMLTCPSLFVPKSRQIRVSWAIAAFLTWAARLSPYRHIVYQTQKEDDANEMVSKGAKNPGAGRMDFIEGHLPDWLSDPALRGGAGNLVGKLHYSSNTFDPSGMKNPWKASKIEGVPKGADQVRGKTAFIFVSDEAAHQEELQPALMAIMPAVHGGGRYIAASSVNAGSFFNQVVLESPDQSPLSDFEPELAIPQPVSVALEALGCDPFRLPKGMRSWRTPSGGWVLEIHYTADPDKDPATENGRKWVEEAVQNPAYSQGGFKSLAWRQEYEIDYMAGGGDPVFPFLADPTHPIFTGRQAPKDIDLMHHPDWEFFAGYDYGTRNPAAFIVTARNRKTKEIQTVWELYEPCKNLAAHCEKLKRCPYWGRLEYIRCDPSVTTIKNQHTASGLKTLGERFSEHGVHMYPGRRGVDVQVVTNHLLGGYWKDPANPTGFITAATPSLAREVRELRWAEHRTEAVNLYKNKLEQIRQKNNHATDAWCYCLDAMGEPELIPRMPAGDFGTLAWAEGIIDEQDRGRKHHREYVGP